jgi:hypothetical protein
VEKDLEKLETTESTTLALKREDGGKIRVASMLWEDARVILRDEVLVVRNVDGPAPCRGSPGTTTTRTSGRVLMTLAPQLTK